MIFICAAALAAIAAIDLKAVAKHGGRNRIVFIAFSCFVFAYALVMSLDIEFLNSIEALHFFFENTLGLSYGLLSP